MHEIRSHKFAISHEKTGVHFTYSFISFKIKFNPLTIRHMSVSKQLSSTSNIFKKTALTCLSYSFAFSCFCYRVGPIILGGP